MNRTYSIATLFAAATLILTGCATPGLADEGPVTAALGDLEGTFQVTRHNSTDSSHDDAIVVFSKDSVDADALTLFFLPVKGDYAGLPVGCMKGKRGEHLDAFVCRRWTGDQRVTTEKFVVALLDSDYCRDERSKNHTGNPIMPEAECRDGDPKNCFCYNVSHCRTPNVGDACTENPPARNRSSVIGVLGPMSPPGNGSGSGGRWP